MFHCAAVIDRDMLRLFTSTVGRLFKYHVMFQWDLILWFPWTTRRFSSNHYSLDSTFECYSTWKFVWRYYRDVAGWRLQGCGGRNWQVSTILFNWRQTRALPGWSRFDLQSLNQFLFWSVMRFVITIYHGIKILLHCYKLHKFGE